MVIHNNIPLGVQSKIKCNLISKCNPICTLLKSTCMVFDIEDCGDWLALQHHILKH